MAVEVKGRAHMIRNFSDRYILAIKFVLVVVEVVHGLSLVTSCRFQVDDSDRVAKKQRNKVDFPLSTFFVTLSLCSFVLLFYGYSKLTTLESALSRFPSS